MWIVRQLGLITCKAVPFGTRTTRGHFASAGITDARSTLGGEDDVEEIVAIANCAVSIREVNDKREQV